LNSNRRIARYIALTVGVLLCGIGILHDILNVGSVTRAISRGDIAEKLGPQLIANVAASGLALFLLGLFLLVVAGDLQRGKRLAWSVALVVGVLLIIIGLVGYWWEPIPHIFVFSALGLVVASPLLIWRQQFMVD
jgi:hypothetical protein